jgi:hypothetical protein
MDGKSALALIGRAWTIWAHFSGMALLSIGIAYLIVVSVSGDDAVIIATSPPRGFPSTVIAGGTLSYSIDVRRVEVCPGEVVTTFTALQTPSPITIVTRRAVASLTPGSREDSRVILDLPDAVSPGLWAFQSGVDSVCPLRQKFDVTVPSRTLQVLPRSEG